jgi:hypothetical protein
MGYQARFDLAPPPPDADPNEVVLWLEPVVEELPINADIPHEPADQPINADVPRDFPEPAGSGMG